MKFLFLNRLKSHLLILSALVSLNFMLYSTADAQHNAITWHTMKEAQQLAKKSGKKVLIFAQADWCVYCKKMREEVFPRQAVIDSMNTYFFAVKLNVESDSSIILNGKKITQQQFAQNTHLQATPTIFFMDKDGQKLGAQPGFIPAPTFIRLLGFVGSDAYKSINFKTYLQQHATQ